jgi:hypothetical protein
MATPNRAAVIVQRKIKRGPNSASSTVKLSRRLQFALEPTVCGILLHWIRPVAILATEPSRFPARRRHELQPRAAPLTPAISDLSHAGILAERRGLSILNAVVLMENSTLEGALTPLMRTCRLMSAMG